MVVKVKLRDGAKKPVRKHQGDAGADLCAMKDMIVPAHGRVFVETNVSGEWPEGTVGFVKSRSGLMKNYGITTDGTIDYPYRGEIGVVLFNHSDEDFEVKRGDRIAQLVLIPCYFPGFIEVDELDSTDRGNDGFGSTGK